MTPKLICVLALVLICYAHVQPVPTFWNERLRYMMLQMEPEHLTSPAHAQDDDHRIAQEPSMVTMARSRVFADVNTERPAQYWDYDETAFAWGNQDHFTVGKKLGYGKFSEVYQGTDITNGQTVVLKLIKPIKKKKIRREVKILQAVCNGPNIIQLLNVTRNEATSTPTFVFEWVNATPYRDFFPVLTVNDIQLYLFSLLKALHYAHSQGIMHRDVKPINVMINHANKRLWLIDWGLAEFYFPGREYNVRVASRYYKPPELMLDLMDYDYSLDLWSTGCMMATMMFGEDPFFKGDTNPDQLNKIAEILGSPRLKQYIHDYDIQLPSDYIQSENSNLDGFARVPWTKFISDKNQHRVTPSAIDLLDRLLQYDHSSRLTAAEAMAHPFFDPVRPKR